MFRRAALAAILLAVSTGAQATDDITRGEALSKRWCVSCHVIGPDVQGGDAGPSFISVAERDGADAGKIETWLADPHPVMPDPGLAKPEYKDIAAYIMSLAP